VGNKEEMLKRRDHYAAGLDLENPALLALVEELMIFNRTIWAAEDDIREGRDKEVGLEEIGRRALKVKGLNAQRVLVKDKISKLTLTGFQEAKVNYAS
jgi:hypothetical protein